MCIRDRYSTADHPLGGNYSSEQGSNTAYSGAFGMLSASEQKAYDNAVSSGNVNVANHYAIINHHRHLEEERGETSEGTKVNLAGTETPSGGSDNDNAPTHAEIIAAANADAAAVDPSAGTTGDFAGTETI